MIHYCPICKLRLKTFKDFSKDKHTIQKCDNDCLIIKIFNDKIIYYSLVLNVVSESKCIFYSSNTGKYPFSEFIMTPKDIEIPCFFPISSTNEIIPIANKIFKLLALS